MPSQRQSKKRHRKKCLRTSIINMIIPSLPAAASNSDCRRHSHPDCRATPQIFENLRRREQARSAQRGLWSGAFIAPWDWRHRNCKTVVLGAVSVPINAQPILCGVPDAPSRECDIKGHVNRKGERIYFLPGQLDYARLDMAKPKADRRWFCSAEDAEAAGHRRAFHLSPCARRAGKPAPRTTVGPCAQLAAGRQFMRGAETGADFCAEEGATVSSRSRDFASGDRRIDPIY